MRRAQCGECATLKERFGWVCFVAAWPAIFLIVTGATAIAADAPANRQDIQITLSNFSFNPNMLHLQRNMVYAIHLMNSASGGHSFSAPGLFAAVTVAPEDRAKIVNGRIEIQAGQTVDITVTPMMAGSYPIVCSHFLHSTFGMKGDAVIESSYPFARIRRALSRSQSRAFSV